MEQVFELVNSLLRQDRETRRRKLKVRDYKVIPLASQAGILEFVGNTAPLKQWLNAKHSAYVLLVSFSILHLTPPQLQTRRLETR